LLRVCRIDAFLHDAASVHMACDRATVLHHCIVDELLVLVGPRVQDLLDHMVAIDFISKRHKF